MNDGRFQQEHHAELTWKDPAAGVYRCFGLTQLNETLRNKRQEYNRLEALFCPSFSNDFYDTVLTTIVEAEQHVALLRSEANRIESDIYQALQGIRDERRIVTHDLRERATRELLETNDRENEEHAMDALLAWLEELNGSF